MVEEKYIKQVFEDTKKAFEGETITSSSIITLAVRAMELVEKLPALSGSEKKQVVVQVVKLIIDETELSDDDNAKIDVIIDTTLPLAIDFIVAASRGVLNINGVKSRLKKLCCC